MWKKTIFMTTVKKVTIMTSERKIHGKKIKYLGSMLNRGWEVRRENFALMFQPNCYLLKILCN